MSEMLKNSDLNTGDVVYLKCGGPGMTVTNVGPIWVDCIWFNNDDQLERAKFSIECLTKDSE